MALLAGLPNLKDWLPGGDFGHHVGTVVTVSAKGFRREIALAMIAAAVLIKHPAALPNSGEHWQYSLPGRSTTVRKVEQGSSFPR
jgi:hypothetical protein